MLNEDQKRYLAAIIGAGPAGLYAAKQLASDGVHTVLINRDIKPGGLAEYGIYPTKYKMKTGLRKQFRRILKDPLIEYIGNVTAGEQGDVTLDELQDLGFQAMLISVGAQGTKWLGLPGEDIPRGVYHAKDLVYYYNKLPPFSEKEYHIGQRVALIGVGNVMLDIARWLVRTLKIEEVIAIARRGPAEVKFDKKEMEYVVANLDLDALDAEMARVAPVMESVGQDVEAAKEFILAALPKALEPVSATRFRFNFLASPSRILGNSDGQVNGLEVEETTLVPRDGDTKAKGLGTKKVLNVDTVIFCIGDRVEETFGLPVRWNEFVKNPDPEYPVDGNSYEAFDLEEGRPIPGVFMAGWSREASSGLVGIARKDGHNGATALYQYLQNLSPLENCDQIVGEARLFLQDKGIRTISKHDIQILEAAEAAEAARQGLEEFKFKNNLEMLAAIEAQT
jgi:ferredoxin--NADP+ reductase